jgi:hypothetical protein
LSQGKFKAFAIIIGEGADAKIDAREIQSFARAELASDRYFAMNFRSVYPLDNEVHQAIVEKKLIARFYDARQRFETHRNAMLIAKDYLISENQSIPRRERDGAGLDLAEPHFGAWQVGHDRHATPGLGGRRSNQVDHFLVLIEGAMGKIEPGDRHARANETIEHLG